MLSVVALKDALNIQPEVTGSEHKHTTPISVNKITVNLYTTVHRFRTAAWVTLKNMFTAFSKCKFGWTTHAVSTQHETKPTP